MMRRREVDARFKFSLILLPKIVLDLDWKLLFKRGYKRISINSERKWASQTENPLKCHSLTKTWPDNKRHARFCAISSICLFVFLPLFSMSLVIGIFWHETVSKKTTSVFEQTNQTNRHVNYGIPKRWTFDGQEMKAYWILYATLIYVHTSKGRISVLRCVWNWILIKSVTGSCVWLKYPESISCVRPMPLEIDNTFISVCCALLVLTRSIALSANGWWWWQLNRNGNSSKHTTTELHARKEVNEQHVCNITCSPPKVTKQQPKKALKVSWSPFFWNWHALVLPAFACLFVTIVFYTSRFSPFLHFFFAILFVALRSQSAPEMEMGFFFSVVVFRAVGRQHNNIIKYMAQQ